MAARPSRRRRAARAESERAADHLTRMRELGADTGRRDLGAEFRLDEPPSIIVYVVCRRCGHLCGSVYSGVKGPVYDTMREVVDYVAAMPGMIDAQCEEGHPATVSKRSVRAAASEAIRTGDPQIVRV